MEEKEKDMGHLVKRAEEVGEHLCPVELRKLTKDSPVVLDPTAEGLKKRIPMNAPKNIGCEEGDVATGLVNRNEESPDLSKNVVGELKMEDVLEGEATLGKSISSGILKHVLPPVSSVVFGVDGKKYPPRRRMSAVRDFPPLRGTPLYLAEMQSLDRKGTTEDVTGEANPSGKKIVDNKLMAVAWRQEKETEKKPTFSGGASRMNLKLKRLAEERKKNISKKRVWKLPKRNDSPEVFKEKCSMKKLKRISKLSDLPSYAHGGGKYAYNDSREKVRDCLCMFHRVVRFIVRQNEAMAKGDRRKSLRVDLHASDILKKRGEFVNPGKPIMGVVRGVEVGDEYRFRVELNIIGLHRVLQDGIDYLKEGSDILATSVVASGDFGDGADGSDVLYYIGNGGNAMRGNKAREEQNLEWGNLALMNSMSRQKPVRVIYEFKERKAAGSSAKKIVYSYDGLYLVSSCRVDTGQPGKKIFIFQLNRMEGQPEAGWRKAKRARKQRAREGLHIEDISRGEEAFRICAVNTVDDETLPDFTYVRRMMYPSWFHQKASKDGCDCVDVCSVSRKCSCAVKNGGEIAYNYSGDIVEEKFLVYECGPSCRCPPSCFNRVSQHGMRHELEVFKTEGRGWGVRSLDPIASGNYICEYFGTILSDSEAEERIGNNDYLFHIVNNYYDHTLLHDADFKLVPDSSFGNTVEEGFDGRYTIDAANFGNIGRFINHSYSPNLFAQNVCYDLEDTKIPHIILFAADDIPPLQELMYSTHFKSYQPLEFWDPHD